MEQLATAALQPNDFAPQKKEGSDVILLGLRCVTQPNRLHFFIVYLCDCALCEVNIPHPRLQPRPGRRGADRQEVQDVKRGRKFKSNLDIDQEPFAPPGGKSDSEAKHWTSLSNVSHTQQIISTLHNKAAPGPASLCLCSKLSGGRAHYNGKSAGIDIFNLWLNESWRKSQCFANVLKEK